MVWMRRNKKSTLMIANNTFVKYAKIYPPGPNPISTESKQKVMLSVEQILLHLPTAKFLHFPLKHLAKASEKASDNQLTGSGNKWILGLTQFDHFKVPVFPGSKLQSPYLHIQSPCRHQGSEAIWSSIASACDGLWIPLYYFCFSLKLQNLTDD